MATNQDDNVTRTREASLQMLTERFRLNGFPASVYERMDVDYEGKEIDGKIMFYVLRIRKVIGERKLGYDWAIVPDELTPSFLTYQLEQADRIVRSLHEAIEKGE
jgi:hypothetical protein